jgi:hypothetical protein
LLPIPRYDRGARPERSSSASAPRSALAPRPSKADKQGWARPKDVRPTSKDR